MLHAPLLDGLDLASRDVLRLARRLDGARAPTNTEGGDVGSSGSGRSLVRHVANYLAAARLAEQAQVQPGTLVDVGAGVGTLTAWLAARLGMEGHLVDADPAVRAAAAAAYPELSVHADLAEAPQSALVTAMEVVEHIPPAGQRAFVQALVGLVAPGGLLVLSTPDESRYAGGWSGYAPHVGVLDATGLRDLLASASGGPVQVWRFEGEVFDLGRLARIVQPVGNRLWGAASALAPAAVGRLVQGLGSLTARAMRWDADEPRLDVGTAVRVVPPDQGKGTGLLAAVRLAG